MAKGIPEWPLVSWATKAGIPINKQYAFHNTNVSKGEYHRKSSRGRDRS